MNVTQIALSFALDVAAGKPPPKEFRIAAQGRTETDKGPYVFDDESAKSVIENAKKWGNRYSMDYEHRALFAASTGTGEAPASAWYDLEIRNGELWAVNVQWTSKAHAYLSGEPPEYRYFSPVFNLTKDRHVTELINLALTNLPATHGMESLAASKSFLSPEEKPMKHLLAALSLAETATESDALAALSKHKETSNSLLALTGKATASEALGVVAGWKGEAEKVTALSAKVAEYEKSTRTAEVETLIAAGKQEGKIAPAAEAFFRDMGTKDPSQLKAFLSVATPVVPTEPRREPNKDGATVNLTPEELKVASMMRVDHKALAATKASIEARGE